MCMGFYINYVFTVAIYSYVVHGNNENNQNNKLVILLYVHINFYVETSSRII